MKTPFINFIILTFILNTTGPLPVRADELRLPVPEVMVHLSPPEDPPLLKGVTVYPNNPFKFDFILDKGDSLQQEQLKQESEKLVKYFLAAITTPENDLWVNLSPYEKNRIIPQSFGQTDMGRDLLGEDYILKQITASLVYPEDEIGKKFWKRVYEEAQKKYGTTNIPVNTFNKVWIVPDHAKVYEHGNTAFIIKARLKVMLEEDYLALSKHQGQPGDMSKSEQQGTCLQAGCQPNEGLQLKALQGNPQSTNALASKIVRELVIPELDREVNEGKNFAALRQVYYSLVLAVWFKKRMKDSILGRKYIDQNKVTGIHYDPLVSLRGAEGDAAISERTTNDTELIYQRYLKAFKKGVYNYIKEEPDPMTQEMIPKKYFSGGFQGSFAMNSYELIPKVSYGEIPNSDQVLRLEVNLSNRFSPAMKAVETRRSFIRKAALTAAAGFLNSLSLKAAENEVHDNLQLIKNGGVSKKKAAITALRNGLLDPKTQRTTAAAIVGEKDGLKILINEPFDPDYADYLAYMLGEMVALEHERIPSDQKAAIADKIYHLLWSKENKLIYGRWASYQAMSKIIKYSPEQRYLLDKLWSQRRKFSVLSNQRRSPDENIVLAIYDAFLAKDKPYEVGPSFHGFAVLSVELTTIFEQRIDLNDDKIIGLVAIKHAMGKSLSESIEEVLKENFGIDLRKSGVTLEAEDSNLVKVSQLIQRLNKSYKNRTIVVNISKGYAGWRDPQRIIGDLDSKMIAQASKVNEFVFSIASDNAFDEGGMPRTYTYDMPNNLVFVGATDPDSLSAKREAYSNYGPDVRFSTPALSLDRRMGTSFAAPVFSGMMITELLRNKQTSIKTALQDLEDQSKGDVKYGGKLVYPAWWGRAPHSKDKAMRIPDIYLNSGSIESMAVKDFLSHINMWTNDNYKFTDAQKSRFSIIVDAEINNNSDQIVSIDANFDRPSPILMFRVPYSFFTSDDPTKLSRLVEEMKRKVENITPENSDQDSKEAFLMNLYNELTAFILEQQFQGILHSELVKSLQLKADMDEVRANELFPGAINDLGQKPAGAITPKVLFDNPNLWRAVFGNLMVSFRTAIQLSKEGRPFDIKDYPTIKTDFEKTLALHYLQVHMQEADTSSSKAMNAVLSPEFLEEWEERDDHFHLPIRAIDEFLGTVEITDFDPIKNTLTLLPLGSLGINASYVASGTSQEDYNKPAQLDLRNKPLIITFDEKRKIYLFNSVASQALIKQRAEGKYNKIRVPFIFGLSLLTRRIRNEKEAGGNYYQGIYANTIKELGLKYFELKDVSRSIGYEGITGVNVTLEESLTIAKRVLLKVYEETGEDFVKVGVLDSLENDAYHAWPKFPRDNKLFPSLQWVPLDIDNYYRSLLWEEGLNLIFDPKTDQDLIQRYQAVQIPSLGKYFPANQMGHDTDELTRDMIQIKNIRDQVAAEAIIQKYRNRILQVLNKGLGDIDVIVPVPKQDQEGNQMAYIAIAMGAAFDKSVDLQALSQVKNADEQKLLNYGERLRNVIKLFSVQEPQSVRGKTVLLIDDVWTSGATMEAARNVLYKAGAKRVFIFAFAKTNQLVKPPEASHAMRVELPKQIQEQELKQKRKRSRSGPGGIDLTAKRMDLEVEKDKTEVSRPINLRTLENIQINGLYIKDIKIRAIKNLSGLLGVSSSTSS